MDGLEDTNIKFVLEPGDFIVPIDECAISDYITKDKQYEVVEVYHGDPIIIDDNGDEIILNNFNPESEPPFNKNEIKYIIKKDGTILY